jgi:hypothetical protein
MMDDRKPAPNGTVGSHAGWPLPTGEGWLRSARYYHKTFALNQLYANRHGLELVLVRPTMGPWLQASTDPSSEKKTVLCPAWCRVKSTPAQSGTRGTRADVACVGAPCGCAQSWRRS